MPGELTTELYPEVGNELYTLVDTTVSAMKDDDNPQRAHPIKGRHLKTAERFQAWYDLHTHTKSAAVLRMFVLFYGMDNFKSTIRELILWSTDGLVDAEKLWNRLSSHAPAMAE